MFLSVYIFFAQSLVLFLCDMLLFSALSSTSVFVRKILRLKLISAIFMPALVFFHFQRSCQTQHKAGSCSAEPYCSSFSSFWVCYLHSSLSVCYTCGCVERQHCLLCRAAPRRSGSITRPLQRQPVVRFATGSN